jgi:hypothetical protein
VWVAVAEDDWCSVSEAARRLGVTPTAIRNRIRRGTLEHRANGNQGKLVRVPRTVPLTVPEPVPPTVPEPLGGTVPPGVEGTIKALEAHVRQLSELLARQRIDHAAELERVRLEIDRARDDADRQREHADAMLKQVKDLVDRVNRLHDELEQARRPWWLRWFGR